VKLRAWLDEHFELSRGGAAANVPAMEGMRGFAVFLVFLVHYIGLIQGLLRPEPATTAFIKGASLIGNCGVDLFFVLSGYLIYGSLMARHPPYGRFLRRRVQRIYPVFIAVFAVYLALSAGFPAQSKIPAGPGRALGYLLFNFLLLPGIVPVEAMITVAWSLSYEMFFYLVLPPVVALLAPRERSAGARALGFALAALAWTAISAFVEPLPVRLILFLAGMLVWEALGAGLGSRLRAGGVLGALALLGALAFKLLPLPGRPGFVAKIFVLFLGFGLLCFCVFARPESWLARAFAWTPLRWLGNMSYSYYLVHGLALHATFLFVGRALGHGQSGMALFFGLLPFAFAVSVLVAAAVYLAIELRWSLRPSRAPAPR